MPRPIEFEYTADRAALNALLMRSLLLTAAVLVVSLALGAQTTMASASRVQARVVAGAPPLGMLNDPRGVTVSPVDGTIYAVDRAHARIQVFTSAGVPLGQLGSRGDAEGSLWRPSDVAVSPDGRTLYVVDTGHRRVLRFRPSVGCITPPHLERCFVDSWGGRGVGDGLFEAPVGVAVDGLGRVYVVDQDRHNVQVFDPLGTFLHAFGGAGVERGRLLRPTDVAIGPDGQVWIADHDNHRIARFSADGRPRGSIEGSGGNRLYRPSGIAVAADGGYVVADRRPEGLVPRITAYHDSGRILWRNELLGHEARRGSGYPQLGVAVLNATTVVYADPREPQFALYLANSQGKARPFGLRGQGVEHFDLPVDVAIDEHFTVVADAAIHTVLLLDPDTHEPFTRIGGLFQSGAALVEPAAVAVARYGVDPSAARIYVADPPANAVLVFAPDGRLLDRWGGEPSRSPAALDTPWDVAVGSDGSVYIADTNNSRIVRRAADGSVANMVAETGDGPSEVRYPVALAVAPPTTRSPDSHMLQAAGLDATGLDAANSDEAGVDAEGVDAAPAIPGDGALRVADLNAGSERIYVLERNQSRLKVFTPDGAFIGMWPGAGTPEDAESGAAWGPVAIAADAEHLYLLESDGRDHVRLAAYHHPLPDQPLAEARVAVLSDRVGASPGRLWDPRGLAAAGPRRVTVADSGNNRLQVLSWLEDDSSTEDPAATATMEPEPTATSEAPDPSAPPSPTPTAEASPTPDPDATATPSDPEPSPTPDDGPEPSPTPDMPEPSATPEATATPDDDPTAVPSATPEPTTASPTETPTAYPTPEPEPPATLEPTDVPVEPSPGTTIGTPQADAQPTPNHRRYIYLPVVLR